MRTAILTKYLPKGIEVEHYLDVQKAKDDYRDLLSITLESNPKQIARIELWLSDLGIKRKKNFAVESKKPTSKKVDKPQVKTIDKATDSIDASEVKS